MIITNKPCLFDLNCDNAMLQIMNSAILCEYDPTNGQSAIPRGRDNILAKKKQTNLSVIYWSPRAKKKTRLAKEINETTRKNKQLTCLLSTEVQEPKNLKKKDVISKRNKQPTKKTNT